jgi:hypothetical protein
MAIQSPASRLDIILPAVLQIDNKWGWAPVGVRLLLALSQSSGATRNWIVRIAGGGDGRASVAGLRHLETRAARQRPHPLRSSINMGREAAAAGEEYAGGGRQR